MLERIEVNQARRPIKDLLLGEGGSAQLHLGDTTRMLYCSVFDRPAQKLPWPLSALQVYNIHLVVKQGDNTVVDRTFGKGEIDVAIDLLFEGVDPEEKVLLMSDPMTGVF